MPVRPLRWDHVSIAVPDLDAAVALYRDRLGMREIHRETLPGDGVEAVRLQAGDCVIELIRPLDDTGPVARFLEKRGAGLHHVCLQVADLRATIAELKQTGVELIDTEPRPGLHRGVRFF